MSIVFPLILGRAPSSAWSRSVTFFFNIYYLDHLEHLHDDDGEIYDDDLDDLEQLHYDDGEIYDDDHHDLDDEKLISLILV